MYVVPDIEAFADDTALATTKRCLDRHGKLDGANMREAAVEEWTLGFPPDRGRVDREGLDIAGNSSLLNNLGGCSMRKGIIRSDEVRVGVLRHFPRGRGAVSCDVGPDTSARGMNVDWRLASGLETLIRTG